MSWLMNASDSIAVSAERPARGPTKRQLNATATRDRIIEATILCMANYGPAGASVEKITATAGVSRGLVRHHFGSKNQLFLESFERLADEMRQAFSGDDPEDEVDPIEALRKAIANEFRVTTSAPVRAHAWFGFWQATLGDPALQEVNDRVYAEERERFSELFREAALRRDLSLDYKEAGIALVALVDGAWNELLMRAVDFGVDDAQTLCNHFIDMVVGQGEAFGRSSPAPSSTARVTES
jgi:AcrR family transcriptional regulator